MNAGIKFGLRVSPHRAWYGIDNPNVPLLDALADAGVQIYVWGQNAVAFGLTQENTAGTVAARAERGGWVSPVVLTVLHAVVRATPDATPPRNS